MISDKECEGEFQREEETTYCCGIQCNDVSTQGKVRCEMNVLNLTNVKLHSLHEECVCFM